MTTVNDTRLNSVKLLLTRSTHGTHVYAEEMPVAARQTFPTIYVKKHKLPDPPPHTIWVTVEYNKEDCK